MDVARAPAFVIVVVVLVLARATRLAPPLGWPAWQPALVFVIDAVNGYVLGARPAVVAIVRVAFTVLPVEVPEAGLNPPLAPTGNPETEKSKEQALPLPLNVRLTA